MPELNRIQHFKLFFLLTILVTPVSRTAPLYLPPPRSCIAMSSDYPRPYRHDSLSTPTAFSLTMERPRIVRLSLHHKKLNPWSDTMTHEFHAILTTFANDPEVDVILLTGEGPAFCAGLDVTSSSLMSMIDSDDAARNAFALRKHIDEFQASLTMLERCGKPVIAAVHGIVYGLGIDLMAACDVRFADRGSRFAVREVVSSIPTATGFNS